MKSINLKRIATAGIGAALLGASLAAAVSVDNTGLANFKLFNNAEPNVKIVVGSAAMPSDAVAAANIAAMIGNLAYTSSDITVLGKDALSCEGGGTSGGTSITATVTTPGVNPSIAYQMKTYIEGYLDYDTIDDRSSAWDTLGRLLPTDTITTYAGRKITSYETPLAYKGTISDTQVSKSYVEEEKYYFYANSKYYTTTKTVRGEQTRVGYEAVFTDPIVVCANGTTPSASTCTETQYLTDRHRLKIKFLGADWVIYGLNNFVYGGTAIGAQIVIGKEVQYKEFMQIGDEATAPNGIKITLKDISGMPYGTSYVPAASFDIYDASGNKIDTATLQETGTAEYNKYGVVVKVWKAFVGTGGSAYAQVSIFSDKLILTDGAEVDIDNRPWSVRLYGGGATFGASLARIQVSDTTGGGTNLNAGEGVNLMKKPAAMKLTYNGLETPSSTDTLSMSFLSPQYLPGSTADTTTKASTVLLSSTRSNAFTFGGDSSDKAYLVIGSVTGAKVGQVYYYKNGYYTAFNGTGYSTVNVTVPITTAITLTAGSGWTLNTTGASAGADNCTNMSSSVTAFSGTTYAAGGTSTGAANLINAAGTSVTLNNEGALVYYLAANAQVTNSTGTYTCNNTVSMKNTTSGGTNGTITGFTISQFQKNYITYNYGPNTVIIGFDATQLQTGLCATNLPAITQYAIHIPEYTTDSDGTPYAYKIPIGGTAQTAQCFVPTSGTAYIGYGAHPYTYNTDNTATNYETGIIGRRGSTATISSGSVTITYPSTLSHALYTFGAASLNATGNTASDDYAEGATILSDGGYKVTLDKISCGAVSGADMTGADGLSCSSDKAYVVEALDTSTTPLVVTDASGMASGTETIILVGGPLVNTFTAAAVQGSSLANMAPGDAVVKVVGDKIVVAGYTAADTIAAANELIKWLSANSDSLVR